MAGLLARDGHEVIGITLQLYDHGQATSRKGACCAGQDIHDARRAAEVLGIPHYVLDYEQRFADAVMRPFADSYVAGETPIPCVTCNQEIKFRDLLATARDLGADIARDRPLRPALATSTAGRLSTGRATRIATRAISCSPPRASSSSICGFRSATDEARGSGAGP